MTNSEGFLSCASHFPAGIPEMYFKGKWCGAREKEPLVGVLAASGCGPTERRRNGITERTWQGSGCASGGFQ